jgi:hypothetical protein
MILHCYSEKNRGQQQETWDAIAAIETAGYTVKDELTTTRDDSAYWKVLLRNWGKGVLILIEQDIVPTVSMIEGLAHCYQPVCTYPYKIQDHYSLWQGVWEANPPPSYGKHGLVDFGKTPRPTATIPLPEPFPEYAEGSGIGLVKLSKEMQNAIPLADYPAPHQWDLMDTWISSYMSQVLQKKWHVHTPNVKHNHY